MIIQEDTTDVCSAEIGKLVVHQDGDYHGATLTYRFDFSSLTVLDLVKIACDRYAANRRASDKGHEDRIDEAHRLGYVEIAPGTRRSSTRYVAGTPVSQVRNAQEAFSFALTDEDEAKAQAVESGNAPSATITIPGMGLVTIIQG